MTELEKLESGLEYDFWDKEVDARKLQAVIACSKLNSIPVNDQDSREIAIKELFGQVGTTLMFYLVLIVIAVKTSKLVITFLQTTM